MGHCRLLWDLFQLKRNEHKTKEQIQALQEKKLQKLLSYAYHHSVYYKEIFEMITKTLKLSVKIIIQ